MKLENYLKKHGWEMENVSDETLSEDWKRFWMWAPNGEESEPEFFLIKSPRCDNYQVRNLYSKTLRDGQMMTDQDIKNYIKAA